ncbi:molybdenum cofactor sulfurase [endosymbiont 'TC1' of Trimyema compressum]|uniref:MOSC domain-containing protein n=1 Tax=endosymbiont 'TC1' of Trimyema compressum TaxID=243899 RepID=UPI0007F0CCEA|nr:MOSC domain-containing protein [endosymbiont 'TC1' of Trimyema compressum]AMP20108.1 molybdenum cofactor sulfurase [endosymbiont 'TC1' of Trimyema compressum]
MPKVIGVCISEKKGEQKKEIPFGECIVDFGIKNDAHGGNWHRQISLLAKESVDTMRATGIELINGDFAENIITEGIVLKDLPIGTRLKIGGNLILEVTQIGKECHSGCVIQQKAGKCVMPTEGIFAIVVEPGLVKKGDNIEVM